MNAIHKVCAVVVLALLAGPAAPAVQSEEIPYSESFPLDTCRLQPRGVNHYFIPLIPGQFLLLKGEEENDEGETETVAVCIQVLGPTRKVAGVHCSIVREMEWVNDELVEVSWNYMAYCRVHGDIYYYGEDVDIYEDGEVVSHGGAWLAGSDGARPGLLMPGLPLNGSRYYQEVAPEVALDRAEHLDDMATVETPAGTFERCVFIRETTPLEPGAESFKAYAPGIGLVLDDIIRLVAYGRRVGWCKGCPDGGEED